MVLVAYTSAGNARVARSGVRRVSAFGVFEKRHSGDLGRRLRSEGTANSHDRTGRRKVLEERCLKRASIECSSAWIAASDVDP